jgi:hypothetical protein
MWNWLKNLFGGKKQGEGMEMNTASQPEPQAEEKAEETTESNTSENSN